MNGVWIMLAGVLAMTARVAIGLVLAIASMGKLRTLRRFQTVIAAYRLVPAPLLGLAATGIALVELAAGATLLAGRREAAIVAVVLLLGYGLAMGVNILRGRRDIDCGCSLTRSHALSWTLVGRNLGLAGIALLAAAPVAPLHWVVVVNSALAGVLLYALYLILEAMLTLPAVRRGCAAWASGA